MEVFRSEHSAPPAVEQFAAIGRKVLAEGHDDPIGEAAVASYFRRLWDEYGAEALDAAMVHEPQGLLKVIGESGIYCPYEQIEAAFQMIEDGQRTVIVCDGAWGVHSGELEDLRFGSAGAVAKRVQPHSVNVPWRSGKPCGTRATSPGGRRTGSRSNSQYSRQATFMMRSPG